MKDSEPRITGPTLKVLEAFFTSPRDELSGAEVGRTAKLPSGTLYPILIRLESAGWLESHWEAEDPARLGRPRKRFYRMTRSGAQKAKAAFREISPGFRSVAWA
jgi:DNA-binding PadR family transcriptional regulator